MENTGPTKQEKTLKEIELHPISVPGLFSLDSEFILNTIIEFEAYMGRVMKGGFEVHFPFNFSVISNKAGIFQKPQFLSKGIPIAIAHPLTITETTSVTSAHSTFQLIPYFSLKMSVLQHNIDLKVYLENSLSVYAEKGIPAHCMSGKTKFSISNQHGIGVSVTTGEAQNNFNLWNTGFHKMSCPFCDVCTL